MSPSLSIVVPLGPRDESLPGFLRDVKRWRPEIEIVIAGGQHKPFSESYVWVASHWGRGAQLNAGAMAASGKWLWFLHADSFIEESTFRRAEKISLTGANAIHYFALRFGDGANWLTRINEAGANWRSRRFAMPFGDQGLLMPKAIWRALGSYPENVPYAEDNLFVWRARRAGVSIVGEKERLITSARKYRERGWLGTTLSHFSITWKEAARQYAERLNRHFSRDANTGLGIFVKTPGLSPIKTRLAAGSSSPFAEAFYREAVVAMEALGRQLNQNALAKSYWAIAEAPGMENPTWKNLPRLYQGEGDLGARIARVYGELKKRHRTAVIVGCDSPHLAEKEVSAAITGLEKNDFVIGPTPDGGFYLFASRRELPTEFWTAIPYSNSETTARLIEGLSVLGTVAVIPGKTDVDVVDDLKILATEISTASEGTYSGPHLQALRTLCEQIGSFQESQR